MRVAGLGPLRVPVAVRVRRGYHINSDQPKEEYLIPTRLAWADAPFPIQSVTYPEAEELRTSFSELPLAVFSDRFEIVTVFQVEAMPAGRKELRGSLKFQACNDSSCLPPTTIPVSVPIRP